MGCDATYMGDAQQKIVSACGQAELSAYIPVLEAACSAAQISGQPMSCDAIAGKKYAAPAADAGGGTCDAGAPKLFSYSGTATADGRSARMSFSVAGTAVTGGTLHADSVCSTNIHLNSTDVTFTGTLSGTWESPNGSIYATWAGGDYACDGTLLTPVEGYPTSGSLTISMLGSVVQLQRIISGAEPYQFAATNQQYTPPSATCSAPPAPDSGVRDSSSGSDALGPVCTKLAACCPTITDLPLLRQDCVTTLSNGMGDSGCQITWNSLTRLGYCTSDGTGGTLGTGGSLGTGGTLGTGGALGTGGTKTDGGAVPFGTGGAKTDGAIGTPGTGGVKTDGAIDVGGIVGTGGTSGSPTAEQYLLKMDSIQGVSYNPPQLTLFTLAKASTITRVMTYHYAATIGTQTPYLAFRDTTTNAIYGPWLVVGYKSFNSALGGTRTDPTNVAGPPDNYWVAYPAAVVPAGTYQVIDSVPATWAYTADLGNRGVAFVYGY
jgi:hypothetical protein